MHVGLDLSSSPLPPPPLHPNPLAANVQRTFAIRFKTPALAQEFAAKYLTAQKTNECKVLPSVPADPDASPVSAEESQGSNPLTASDSTEQSTRLPLPKSEGGALSRGGASGSSGGASSSSGGGSGSASSSTSSGGSGSSSSSSAVAPAAAGSSTLAIAAVAVVAVGAAAFFLSSEAQKAQVRDAFKKAQAAIAKQVGSVVAALAGGKK